MFGLKVKTVDQTKRVSEAVDDAEFKNLSNAAYAIRRTAIKLVERSKFASDPGSPPHTRRGLFDKAIFYKYDKQRGEAVIGTAFSIAGTSGEPHEFGGTYRGAEYPERSFMGPALQQNLARFQRTWGSSVG